jgi:hypothetical protein
LILISDVIIFHTLSYLHEKKVHEWDKMIDVNIFIRYKGTRKGLPYT